MDNRTIGLVIFLCLIVMAVFMFVGVQIQKEMQCEADAEIFGVEWEFHDHTCFFVLEPGYLIERSVYIDLLKEGTP